MSKFDIVRAWKDAEYRQSLSSEEQELLPEHPAGSIELTDGQLQQAAGASVVPASQGPFTVGCCQTVFLTTPCCPTPAFTGTCCPNVSFFCM